MSKSTSFSLGEHFNDFIEKKISEGRYGSASDVVRAGLRLLEEEEVKLAALRASLVAGERSGPAKSFDMNALQRRKRRTKRA
jgi:antitoxin ParD1/3/4